MDAFWGPLMIYGAVFLVGAVIGGLGAGVHESARTQDGKQGGMILAGLGGSIALLGGGGAAVFLIGTCIEKCF